MGGITLELLVRGSGKEWRPDPGGHCEPGSGPEPMESGAQSRDGGPLGQGSRGPRGMGTEVGSLGGAAGGVETFTLAGWLWALWGRVRG